MFMSSLSLEIRYPIVLHPYYYRVDYGIALYGGREGYCPWYTLIAMREPSPDVHLALTYVSRCVNLSRRSFSRLVNLPRRAFPDA